MSIQHIPREITIKKIAIVLTAVCDQCGCYHEYPEGRSYSACILPDGWMSIDFAGTKYDYCDQCASRVWENVNLEE